MNYGRKETRRQIAAAGSRKKKYYESALSFFFKAALVLCLFVFVTGFSAGIGMFKGIIDTALILMPRALLPAVIFPRFTTVRAM